MNIEYCCSGTPRLDYREGLIHKRNIGIGTGEPLEINVTILAYPAPLPSSIQWYYRRNSSSENLTVTSERTNITSYAFWHVLHFAKSVFGATDFGQYFVDVGGLPIDIVVNVNTRSKFSYSNTCHPIFQLN